MKHAIFILLCCTFSIVANSQTSVKIFEDVSVPIKNTGVQVDSFEITKPETAYDLALNLSYLHHVSEARIGKF